MKIQGEVLDKMRAAMKAAAEHYGVEAFKKAYAGAEFSENRMLWDLWNLAHDNLRYDDTHPGFTSGSWPRVIPQDTSFKLYDDRTLNDSHVLTALRLIGKELGLIEK
jgi:hypothetical protein